MNKQFKLLSRLLILAAAFLIQSSSFGQLTVSPGGSADDIIQTIIGTGVTYSNVSITCDDDGYGTFTGGNDASIGISEGVILTTGNAVYAEGPNSSENSSENTSISGDNDLDVLSGFDTNDACILEFDFVATDNNVGVNFVFASEEYEEYVCSIFNDVFAFFISGPNPAGGNYSNENLAQVGLTGLPVSIQNVNNGEPGDDCGTANPELYINNPVLSPDFGYDGYTTVFSANAQIVIGETYHFKIAIADASDSSLDSGVFIQGESFTTFVCDPGVISVGNETITCLGNSQVIPVSTSSSLPGNYAYFIVQDDEIIDIISLADSEFDLGSYPAGEYTLYGISWDGTLLGFDEGQDLDDLSIQNNEGCFNLSNGIPMEVENCFVPNPDLEAGCGELKIAFVLDESGSIDNTPSDEDEYKAGVLTVANGLLNTGAELTIIEFDVDASVVNLSGTLVDDDLISNLDDYLYDNYLAQNYSPAGFTNWEAALEEVQTLSDVNLVIFFTDGNPTAYLDGTDLITGLDAPTMQEALDRAIVQADVVKAQGKHMFVVGVGEVNPANLPLISDTDLYNPPAVDITTGDYTIESFETVAQCLEQSILDVCGADLEITKSVDGEACIGSTVTFTIEVTNNGNPNNLPALNLEITDTVPSSYTNVTLLSVLPGLSINGNAILYEADELAVDETVTIVFTALIDNTDDDVNTAYTEASNSALVYDSADIETEVCCELLYECPDFDGGMYACLSDVPAPNINDLIILDSCEPVEVTISDDILGGGCPDDQMTVSRQYYIDGVLVCNQYFGVVDDVKPTISNVPDNIAINCTDELPTDEPDVEDNCDPSPMLNIQVVYPPASQGGTQDDNCQLRTQTQGGWGSPANGNNPGVYRDANFDAAFPSGLTLGCDYTLTLSSAGAVQDFLPSGGSPSALTENLVDPNGHNVFGGQITALALSLGFDAYDSNFGESSVALKDLIINNGPFENWTVEELFVLANEVYGGCDTNYSSSMISDALAMVNENYVDGTIDLGNLDCDGEEEVCSYEIIRIFTATDNCGNTSEEQQVITVSDNTPPILLNLPSDLSIDCNDPLPEVADVEIEDSCDPNPSLTFSEVIVPIDDCITEIWRVWEGEDSCGNMICYKQTITINDDSDPEFVGEAPNMEIGCNDPIPEIPIITAIDNCDPNPQISFNEESDYSQCPYTITRTWTAIDNCNNDAELVQVITINDEVPPVIEDLVPYLPISCLELDGLTVEAEDDCGDVTITYEDLYYSGGGCYGIFERTWIATDECGNSSSSAQVIEVIDEEPPAFFGVGENMSISCDQPYSIPEVTAVDLCAGEVDVMFNEEIEDGDCIYEKIITWTWTAEDDCGNVGTATKVLTIIDEEPPTIYLTEGTFELPCDQYPETPEVELEDNCSTFDEIDLQMIDDVQPGSCGGSYVLTRTWIATDACDNVSQVVQIFNGLDLVGPWFNNHGDDVTISCDDAIPAPAYDVSDICSEPVSVIVTENIIPTDCASEYTIMRFYTATDECDNVTVEEQVITIEDDTKPVLSSTPDMIDVACGEDAPEVPQIIAEDNCDGLVPVEFTEVYSGDVPPEDALTYCALEDPNDQEDPAWSLVLFELPTGTEYYTTIDAHWATYADEGEGVIAHLYGSVVSSSNPNAGWDFDVWFNNGENWEDWQNEPFPTSYKDDADVAGLNYLNWMYYLVNADESSMTGWGDLEGSSFDISHNPPNFYYGFQEGLAANNVSSCEGIGGWIHYDGLLVDSFNNIEEIVDGGGDFAFCSDCCPDYQITRTWEATDCAGNTVSHTQVINMNSDAQILANTPFSSCNADFNNSGNVDIIDMILLSGDFGCHGDCDCDLNYDHKVDILDMILFSSVYGSPCND